MPIDDFYVTLGVQRTASSLEVRRAYRTLCTRLHPDKGGNAEHFNRVTQAYDVLSDSVKRKHYDETGEVTKSVDDEFLESFGKGSFRDPIVRATAVPKDAGVEDQIIAQRELGKLGSHTQGFEAWMRTRGVAASQAVFDAEAAALRFGVVKESYQPVALEASDVFEVICSGPGLPKEVLVPGCSPFATVLEWGQVAVDIMLSPINPADVYSARLGGILGSDAVEAPYVAGHDGVGVVSKVGPGVKALKEGDTVMPMKPFTGTWRSKAVWLERDLMRVPQELGLPMECLAMSKELCLAYCLLERHGSLKPGDCVILNAANSTVGQTLCQLCKLLKLRAVAVARDLKAVTSDDGAAASWDRMVTYLKSVGATVVLKDEGSLKVELDKLKFFTKPKLAFDAVGADSGLRLADALAEGGELVIYGCQSGKPPAVPWQSFVFKELKISGFNFRKWCCSSGADAKVQSMLQSVAKLVSAGLLILNYTEYDLSTEFEEALDHALDSAKNTKVLLRGSKSPDP